MRFQCSVNVVPLQSGPHCDGLGLLVIVDLFEFRQGYLNAGRRAVPWVKSVAAGLDLRLVCVLSVRDGSSRNETLTAKGARISGLPTIWSLAFCQ